MPELEDKPPVRWTPARYNAWALDVLILAAGLLGLIALFYPKSLFWNTEGWKQSGLPLSTILALGLVLYLLVLGTIATREGDFPKWRVLGAVTVLLCAVTAAATPLAVLGLVMNLQPDQWAAWRSWYGDAGGVMWARVLALPGLLFVLGPALTLHLPLPLTLYLLLLLAAFWLLPALTESYDRDDKSQR